MKVTRAQILKFDRKGLRDEELENKTGWVAKHRVHRSKKTYSRKDNKKW